MGIINEGLCERVQSWLDTNIPKYKTNSQLKYTPLFQTERILTRVYKYKIRFSTFMEMRFKPCRR